MRFAGIDVGAECHMVAVVDEESRVLCRSSPFGEDSSGYAHLFELLGPPEVVCWRSKPPGTIDAIYSWLC